MSKPIELSVVLPVLGKGICMEGMLKLLTIDIAVPYEIIVIGRKQELGAELIQRVCAKYTNLRWLEKDNQVGTLGALQQGIDAANGEYILVVCADTAGPIIAVDARSRSRRLYFRKWYTLRSGRPPPRRIFASHDHIESDKQHSARSGRFLFHGLHDGFEIVPQGRVQATLSGY